MEWQRLWSPQSENVAVRIHLHAIAADHFGETRKSERSDSVNTTYPTQFEPGTIGGVYLKNRIVEAPRDTVLVNPDGSITERPLRYRKEVGHGGGGIQAWRNGQCQFVRHSWCEGGSELCSA